jgi:hypothetical protein
VIAFDERGDAVDPLHDIYGSRENLNFDRHMLWGMLAIVSQRNSWPRHDEFFGTKLRTR